MTVDINLQLLCLCSMLQQWIQLIDLMSVLAAETPRPFKIKTIKHLELPCDLLITEHHAGGDAMFQQVEVDMFRMAALFVVERLKPWLMTYLAALLATAAPAPLIRQASGRCASLALPRCSGTGRHERHLCSIRTARDTVTGTV